MGDRTHVIFRFRNPTSEQVGEINRILDLNLDVEDYVQDVEIDECNYGGSDETEKLQAVGIPHWMRWDRGSDYDAGMQIYSGQEVRGVDIDAHGAIMVEFNPDTGDAVRSELEDARAYWAQYQRFMNKP